MARKLTKKQKDFADKYLQTGNGTLAIRESYPVKNNNTAAVMASENLAKPKVIAYLEDKAERAAQIVFELAENAETDAVKLSASKDILDRAGFSAVDKSLSVTVNTKDLQDQLSQDLMRFRGLK